MFTLAAISAVGQAVVDAIDGVKDDGLLVLPLAVGAGLTMWGAPIVIGFGKRVFGAAR